MALEETAGGYMYHVHASNPIAVIESEQLDEAVTGSTAADPRPSPRMKPSRPPAPKRSAIAAPYRSTGKLVSPLIHSQVAIYT